ncbi:unnamed protein product [Sphagnum jensenii]
MATSSEQRTLWDVAEDGSEEEMRKFLSDRSQVKVNDTEILPAPAFRTALEHNPDMGVAKALLTYPGFEVNYRDFWERTPLHLASCKDARLELVKLLLQKSNTEVNATADYDMTPLHMAARFACPKVVELLLENEGLRIDAKTVDGFTALHLVAEGHVESGDFEEQSRPHEDRCKVVRMLLEAEKQRRLSGVDCHLNERDVLHRFPIHYGVECNSVEVVEELLKWEAVQINAQDIFGLTPLHLALRSEADNREAIVALLHNVQNIAVNIRSVTPSSNEQHDFKMSGPWSTLFLPFQPLQQESSNNLTALHFAARMGSPQIVSSLLQKTGMEVNVQDDRSFTPLDLAIEKGHVEVKNKEGNTPLHLASLGGHVKVVNMMLEHRTKLDLFSKNKDGNTIFHLAAKGGHLEVVKVFLEDGKGKKLLNRGNNDWNRPLHLAIEEGHVNVVNTLLEIAGNKLNLNEKNKDGNTPLHLAAEGGHYNVGTRLLQFFTTENNIGFESKATNNVQKGANKLNLNATNEEENTPLHLAAKEGHVKIVDAMLQFAQELTINANNIRGNTPLHLAAINGHVDVVNKLLEPKFEVDLNDRNRQGQTPLHFATIKCYPDVVKEQKLLSLTWMPFSSWKH